MSILAVPYGTASIDYCNIVQLNFYFSPLAGAIDSVSINAAVGIIHLCSCVLHSWSPGYGSFIHSISKYKSQPTSRSHPLTNSCKHAVSSIPPKQAGPEYEEVIELSELEHGLQTCKEYWNEGKRSISACTTMIHCQCTSIYACVYVCVYMYMCVNSVCIVSRVTRAHNYLTTYSLFAH